MILRKTKIVKHWWEGVVKSRQQLRVYDHIANRMVRPTDINRAWKSRIASDLLWVDFNEWLADNYPFFKGEFNKVGFMTIFYRVSGTKHCTIQSKSARIHAVRFEKWSVHKKWSDERKVI